MNQCQATEIAFELLLEQLKDMEKEIEQGITSSFFLIRLEEYASSLTKTFAKWSNQAHASASYMCGKR